MWGDRGGQARRASRRLAAGLLLVAAALPAWAASGAGAGGGAGDGDHRLIEHIALAMVAATVVALAMKQLGQPLILGYIAAGVAIGPVGLGWIQDQAAIETIAEIGLILLLFMIGLEIDLHKMVRAGRVLIISGLLQFPISVVIGLAAAHLLASAGLPMGGGPYASWYLAAAVGISSTMIVVKLLYDKMELDTLAGRITLGILVFQDLWAIIVLAVQPSLADPQVGRIAETFLTGGVLVAVTFLASRFFLPVVFRRIAKIPELMVVTSLGWCFLVCLAARHVNLSMEMGALIAGVALSTFPYNVEVITKVVSIRDFFITLFFVALGMKIPVPDPAVVMGAGTLAAILVGSRFLGLYPILYALGQGNRVSLLTSINLSQMSEFTLVIVALGLKLGHVDERVLSLVTYAFVLLAVLSTYLITWSHPLQSALGRAASRIGFSDPGAIESAGEERESRPIVFLGFYRIASALLAEIEEHHPDLLDKVAVVDFNPRVHTALKARGIPVIYGDVANMDTLHHAGVHDARLVICTIPDQFLKGTDNATLLEQLRRANPEARVFVTAESAEGARRLYERGAAFVLLPSHAAANRTIPAIRCAIEGTIEANAGAYCQEVRERREILD